MPKTCSTHRFERSSRSPTLRLPPLNGATANMKHAATVSAIRAGCEKNAANPPQPRIASPRYASADTAATMANVRGLSRVCTPALLNCDPAAAIRALRELQAASISERDDRCERVVASTCQHALDCGRLDDSSAHVSGLAFEAEQQGLSHARIDLAAR